MCVIIDNTIGKKINKHLLRRASVINPDGAGWIDLDQGEVHWSMDMEEAVDSLSVTERWIAHFRYATVGSIDIDNCHPYEVEGDRLLMMNGTVKVDAPDGWSDTRTVADMLRHIPQEHSSEFLSRFPARFLLWSEQHGTIRTGKGWHEIDGVHWSKRIGLHDKRKFEYRTTNTLFSGVHNAY